MRLLRFLCPRFSRSLLLAVLALLLVPALVWAAQPAPSASLLLTTKQLWVTVIGAVVPLATYGLNHVGKWLTEPIKALVLAVVSVVVGALYTAIDTSVFGLNVATLELVLSAVVASFAAHALIWKPAGVAARLGGGTNRQQRVQAVGRPRA